MNILTVFGRIDDDLKHFISTNKAAQYTQSIKKERGEEIEMKERTASSFKSALKELPIYKKKVDSFNAHLNLLHALASIKKESHMDESF